MLVRVLVKCELCGKDIPVGTPHFTIGSDDVCEHCASSLTLKEIYNSEKIRDVSFFDGKGWYNPFDGPAYEGDTMGFPVIDVPASNYERYRAEWDKTWNPNNMSDEEYQRWFFSGDKCPELLPEEKFNQLAEARDYKTILRNIYGREVDPASTEGAECLLRIIPELEAKG